MFREQRIRDPLHNLITFEAGEFENVLWEVVCTRPFQRLRRVKQLGFSELTYPGATHTRFAHSVGVFHLARQLMQIVQRSLNSEYRSRRAETALAAALVHDVGHGPFSHAFEDVGKRLGLKLAGHHENISDYLIRNSEIAEKLNQLGSGFANDVADVIKRGPADIYSAVVSSQFDADRLDYMLRDRLMSGSQHSGIDLTWLLSNLEVGSVRSGVDESAVEEISTFVLGKKAVYAAEAYVLGLFQLYPTLYLHKATRGAEKVFSELLLRIYRLTGDGNRKKTGLSKTHPLVRYCSEPESIYNILGLDDAAIWGSLDMLSDARDPAVADLAASLRDRNLWRSIDVRQTVKDMILRDSAIEPEKIDAMIELSCEIINENLEAYRDKNHEYPTILCDKAERAPYKRFEESKGLLNQIIIRADDERLVDLRTRSKVVDAIEVFKLNRAYVRKGDDESSQSVQKMIRDGVEDAKSQAQ